MWELAQGPNDNKQGKMSKNHGSEQLLSKQNAQLREQW